VAVALTSRGPSKLMVPPVTREPGSCRKRVARGVNTCVWGTFSSHLREEGVSMCACEGVCAVVKRLYGMLYIHVRLYGVCRSGKCNPCCENRYGGKREEVRTGTPS